MALTIGEASAINTLVMALTGRVHPVDEQPITVEQQQAAIDLLIPKAHKVLMAGLRPGEVTATAPKVQVIHSRDPDSECGVSVFVNDVRADAGVEDIDPGRGYSRADWAERVADFEGDTSAFGQAAQQALIEAADSKYIVEED